MSPIPQPFASVSTLVAMATAALLVTACDGSGAHGSTPTDAALGPPASSAAQLAVAPPAMTRGIDELFTSWAAAWNAGDGMAFGDYYSTDADFVNPLGAVFSGRAAIRGIHVALFHPVTGPFRGSTVSFAVRRVVPITGTMAIVDATVTVTGFAGTPPGLVQWAPGVLKTRHHSIVARHLDGWEIIAQQITAMQPGIPD
jgi:uncharacterized protein (TIGR02246 family)